MRQVIEGLEASQIREVANEGLGRDGVLKFWFGESDEMTPEFVRQAAIESLKAGETFYAHNHGLPELRDAIATYTDGLHPGLGATHWLPRLVVTSGGVNGLMLACQTLINAGDEVVVVTPTWPNLVAQPRIMGASVVCVPLKVRESGARAGAWVLDMDALLGAITPATKMLVLNAPNNPTGWTLSRDQQVEILAHCRRTGTWILADEVYERLYFAGDTPNGAASSFLDVADPKDRLIVAHSFSKSFLMTGWRLGWLVLPPALVPIVERLAQNLFICASTIAQHAALACFEPASLAEYERRRAEFKARRDFFIPELNRLGLTVPVMPDGAFYGWADVSAQNQRWGLPAASAQHPEGGSWALAFELMKRCQLATTPGRDFGQAEPGRYLRFSYANSMAQLQEAVKRLEAAL